MSANVTDAEIRELLALLREMDARPRLRRGRLALVLALAWALGLAAGLLAGGWL